MRTLTSEELTAFAEEYGLSAVLAQRDYVACRAAYAIASDRDLMSELALKGGFVLRHGYGSPRTSEDIDGTIGTRHAAVDPKRLQRVVLSQCRDLDVRFNPRQPTVGVDSLAFGSVEYVGPFGAGSFGLEMSFRENLLLPARDLAIDRFGIPRFSVRALAVDEMIAEKWRCLIQRSPRRPGDPYDLWFLWTVFRNAKPRTADDLITPAQVRQLTDQKIRLHRAGDELQSAISKYKAGWRAAMEDLPPDAPSFSTMESAIKEAARAWTSWI